MCSYLEEEVAITGEAMEFLLQDEQGLAALEQLLPRIRVHVEKSEVPHHGGTSLSSQFSQLCRTICATVCTTVPRQLRKA